MKQEYRVFIAGAKDLVKERAYLKILANDLSSKYSSLGVHIIAHSYEHFDDDQQAYNEFIEDRADIVIFIIDGRMGEKTEEEFVKASDSFSCEGHPEVMLFMKQFDPSEITPEIARIQGLIKGKLGKDKYHIDYSSLDDLRIKARERIVRFIDNDMATSKGGKKKKSTRKKKVFSMNRFFSTGSRCRYAVYVLSFLCLLLAGILSWKTFFPEELLIFAGGGSVANFIKVNYGIDLDEDYIYTNLASGSAWALLAEEANKYEEKGDSAGSRTKFCSICLSADTIDSDFKNEKVNVIYDNARLVRYYLGEDPLVVYIHNALKSVFAISDSVVSVDDFRRHFKNVKNGIYTGRIFTTTRSSGTLRTYQNLFKSTDQVCLDSMLAKNQSCLFYKNTSSDDLNANKIPYMILGSKYYYPLSLEEADKGKYTPVYIKDNSGYFVSKSLNIYFVAEKETKHLCKIRKPVIEFLKRIKADQVLKKELWGEIVRGRCHTRLADSIINLNYPPQRN